MNTAITEQILAFDRNNIEHFGKYISDIFKKYSIDDIIGTLIAILETSHEEGVCENISDFILTCYSDNRFIPGRYVEAFLDRNNLEPVISRVQQQFLDTYNIVNKSIYLPMLTNLPAYLRKFDVLDIAKAVIQDAPILIQLLFDFVHTYGYTSDLLANYGMQCSKYFDWAAIDYASDFQNEIFVEYAEKDFSSCEPLVVQRKKRYDQIKEINDQLFAESRFEYTSDEQKIVDSDFTNFRQLFAVMSDELFDKKTLTRDDMTTLERRLFQRKHT